MYFLLFLEFYSLPINVTVGSLAWIGNFTFLISIYTSRPTVASIESGSSDMLFFLQFVKVFFSIGA